MNAIQTCTTLFRALVQRGVHRHAATADHRIRNRV